jgi:DNA-binding response OmpR family regulator
MRVLLVEDNARLSKFIHKGLSAEGLSVDLFGTVSEAQAALETIQYNVIVLDLGLPDGDGLDLLRALREKGNNTPVLILTARDAGVLCQVILI